MWASIVVGPSSGSAVAIPRSVVLKKSANTSTTKTVRRAPAPEAARLPVEEIARRAPADIGHPARSGEEKSEAIGQQGRTAGSGEQTG
jgi:hypothetical protein